MYDDDGIDYDPGDDYLDESDLQITDDGDEMFPCCWKSSG